MVNLLMVSLFMGSFVNGKFVNGKFVHVEFCSWGVLLMVNLLRVQVLFMLSFVHGEFC